MMLAVTPEKRIMYNGGKANQHMVGKIEEDDLTPLFGEDPDDTVAGRLRLG